MDSHSTNVSVWNVVGTNDMFLGKALYSSCSLGTGNPQTPSDIHSVQRCLEDVPNCRSPTVNASNVDDSLYMTPVAYRMPTQLTATSQLSAEPVTPCLQSISVAAGFSAFSRVLKDPVYVLLQPAQANYNKSPNKASFVMLWMNFTFSIAFFINIIQTYA